MSETGKATAAAKGGFWRRWRWPLMIGGPVVILAVVAWFSARRGGTGRLAGAVAILSPVYLAALGVAWFAMSAKPGS